MLAVVTGVVTAVLARPVIPSFVQGWDNPQGLLALGLLASGGSGFWNSVQGYVNQVKDIKKQEVLGKKNETGAMRVPAGRDPGGHRPAAGRSRLTVGRSDEYHPSPDKEVSMRSRSMLLAGGLLVVAAAAGGQPPPVVVPPVPPGPLPAPTVQPLGPTAVPPPAVPKIDDLVAELESLQADKARIEKREKEIRAEIQRQLETLQQRLNKIGPRADEAGKAAGPIVLGRVLLVGYPAQVEPKVVAIVEKAGLRPGQPINFPAIESVRTQLATAGLPASEVTVTGTERDGPFKDLLVRAATSEK